LPTTGTYIARFTPAGPGTGTVTMQLEVPLTGTLTAGGSAVTDSVTASGDVVIMNFAGTTGQTVQLVTQVASAFVPALYNSITITEPDGQTQLYAAYPFESTANLSGVLTLPETGTYTVQFSPAGAVTASDNSYQFAGRQNDGNGLYYNRARYYNPAWGRFISEDPLGFGGGDVNLYAYAGGNPINFNDPTGNFQGPLPVTGPGLIGVITRLLPPIGIPAGIFWPSPLGDDDVYCMAGHKKNARPSTAGKHEAGDARRGRDGGGEKADPGRLPPRKKPPGWKGPWPPPPPPAAPPPDPDDCGCD
jgi:RHS repeat-associated protein